jgi:hypothetical protein
VKLASFEVSLTLPYLGGIKGTWQPDDTERLAAWEMYVELATRISTVELGPDEGLIREALTSMYSLFGTTREILRKYGPGVAKPHGDADLSFGYLAVAVLNGVLRPLLARWHPQLADWEAKRPADVSTIAQEQAWPRATELRAEIAQAREALLAYANQLAQVAGVPPLVARPASGEPV